MILWLKRFIHTIRTNPLRTCDTYKKSGCCHVDGYLCNPDTCEGYNLKYDERRKEKMNEIENKFDGLLFRILKRAQPDEVGFVNDDKALILMKEGYLVYSPKNEWYKSGHKTTEKGTKLYEKWLKEIRNNHGHEWMTIGDSEYADEKDSKYNKMLDSFAYTAGEYHNGYKCKKCGFGFCIHCYNEWEIPKCSEKTKNMSFSDDSKLDKGVIGMSNVIRTIGK